jgi:hypothetical protein
MFVICIRKPGNSQFIRCNFPATVAVLSKSKFLLFDLLSPGMERRPDFNVLIACSIWSDRRQKVKLVLDMRFKIYFRCQLRYSNVT